MAGHKTTKKMAVIETRLSAVAEADKAAQRLDDRIYYWCSHRPTQDDLEKAQDDVQLVMTAIALMRSQIARDHPDRRE